MEKKKLTVIDRETKPADPHGKHYPCSQWIFQGEYHRNRH